MKNLMRVKTECYDCAYHTEVEPYGVQDYDLIDGKLYYSDEYEWILVDNFGTEILTDVGYDDEDLGQFPERTMELIKYLISDAPKKGYVECASREEAEEICELLQEYEEKDTWGEIKSYVNAHTDEVVEACKKAEVEAYENANGLDVLVFAEIEDGELVLDSTCDYKDISQDLPKYIIYRAYGKTESDKEDFLFDWDGTIREAIDGCMSKDDFIDKIFDCIEDGKMTEEE